MAKQAKPKPGVPAHPSQGGRIGGRPIPVGSPGGKQTRIPVKK